MSAVISVVALVIALIPMVYNHSNTLVANLSYTQNSGIFKLHLLNNGNKSSFIVLNSARLVEKSQNLQIEPLKPINKHKDTKVLEVKPGIQIIELQRYDDPKTLSSIPIYIEKYALIIDQYHFNQSEPVLLTSCFANLLAIEGRSCE